MEELWELRQALQAGDVKTALALVDEMEAMPRDDKIHKIASYMRVLLVHKIEQAVEGRSTKSWEVSVRHALRQIASANKRRTAGGWYLNGDDLSAVLTEAYESALDWASLEAHEGVYSTEELAAMHMTGGPCWRMHSARSWRHSRHKLAETANDDGDLLGRSTWRCPSYPIHLHVRA